MIDPIALLAELQAAGIRSAVEVLAPRRHRQGAAYVEDVDEIVATRQVLMNHPAIAAVADGRRDGPAWTLLFSERP